MGAPTPDQQAAARRMARRQGLIFGGSLGIATLLLTLCGIFLSVNSLAFALFRFSSTFNKI